MDSRKSNVLFYSLIAFVSIVLSSWIITVSAYKNKENAVLQSQIDSLVNVAKIYHGQDAIIDLNKYLPTHTIRDNGKIKEIIMIHIFVAAIIILFIFLYIRKITELDAKVSVKKGSVFDDESEDKQN